jgi:hypothetical protein
VLGFGGNFGTFNAFLELFLKGLLEKLASLGEEEVFQGVEGFAVGGVIGDEVALVEQGIEFRVKKVTAADWD